MTSIFLPRTPPAALISSSASRMPLCWDWPNVASLPVRQANSPTLMVSAARRPVAKVKARRGRRALSFMGKKLGGDRLRRDAFDEFELAVLHRNDDSGLRGVTFLIDGDATGDGVEVFRGG